MAFGGIFGGFRPAFDAGAQDNGLLNALIAYWPLNETSGNALDLHTNALTLTDVNTVTSATGKVYVKARQFAATNSECLARAGDDALLSVGDTDFSLAAWVYMDSKPANYMMIVGKDSNASGGREYGLRWSNTADRIGLVLLDGTSSVGLATANTYGAPGLSTWLFVVAWHDSVANTANIQINNGSVDSAATTGAPGDTTSRFTVGAYITSAGYWDGRIGPAMMWKSAAGGGGVLTARQRTALYNGGAGLAYAAFTK